ncbi:uncharacterized [Tachysurus ichikawai]
MALRDCGGVRLHQLQPPSSADNTNELPAITSNCPRARARLLGWGMCVGISHMHSPCQCKWAQIWHRLGTAERRLNVLRSHARGWWRHDNLSHHSTHLSSKSKCLQRLCDEEDIDPVPVERRCVCPWVWISVNLSILSLWVKGSAFKRHHVGA